VTANVLAQEYTIAINSLEFPQSVDISTWFTSNDTYCPVYDYKVTNLNTFNYTEVYYKKKKDVDFPENYWPTESDM
jgi:hypothetical protein